MKIGDVVYTLVDYDYEAVKTGTRVVIKDFPRYTDKRGYFIYAITDDGRAVRLSRREVSSKAQDRPPQTHKTTPTNIIQNKPYNAR